MEFNGVGPSVNTLSHEQAEKKRLKIPASGIFAGLRPDQLTDLEAMGVYLEYDEELVTADAQPLQYFFFVIQGDFEVLKVEPETGKKHALAAIGAGECFGEMSFFTRAPASANVVAMGRAVCWAIPHESLRRFIESHEGGATLAINVATLLARRVQEGNTRLVGLSASLSAYFGKAGHAADSKRPEAPQTDDHADMEIPDDVFESFARDVLGLRPDAKLTDDLRNTVRSRIESNEVDIVPWLERGQRGRPLKVRLKFAYDAPRVAVDVVAPPAQETAPTTRQPTVVRVPQVRARAPSVPVYIKTPPPRPSWVLRLINAACFVLLPFLTAYVIFYFIPLDARESIAESEGFKKLPLQGALNRLIFRYSVQSNPVILKRGDQYRLKARVPKPARVVARLEFPKIRLASPIWIAVKVGRDEGNSAPVVDETVEIPANSEKKTLFSARLPPGNYFCECSWPDAEPGKEIPATWIITAQY